MNRNGPPKDKRPPLPNGPGHGRPKGSKNKITKERWEQEVRSLALYDPLQMFERVKGTRHWSLRNIDEMPEDLRRCLGSVKVRTENLTAGDKAQDTTVEVRLLDKIRALELGARANGWLKDKVEISAPEEMLSLLDRAKARARGSE
jgi:hypothetical protein